MELQLIRNATMRLDYAGKLILTDPFLASKHSYPSFGGVSENPTVNLPFSAQHVIDHAELVIISHLHMDHFDILAQNLLPKDIPILCQPGDEMAIAEHEFNAISPLEEKVNIDGVEISLAPGQHGTGDWIEKMGKVSGFVFQGEGEPTVYWCGDTIWYPEIEDVITQFNPEIIITHSSGAKFSDSDPILMDIDQTLSVARFSPDSTIVAIHMECLDHGSVTRNELRESADAAGIPPDRLLIPADGEQVVIN